MMLRRMAEARRIHMELSHLRRTYQGLLLRIVQAARESNKPGFVVVLTSPTQGAGVSRITNGLADALNFTNDRCAIKLDCRHIDFDRYGYGDPVTIDNPASIKPPVWSGDRKNEDMHEVRETLAGALSRFRQLYQYVLIDCPSLRETQDAIRLAPLVDGVVLVVEADRTQKEQLSYAERTVESAKGKILGLVFNKRSYLVPDWLSRRMEAIGI
jgi:hypothetical protein